MSVIKAIVSILLLTALLFSVLAAVSWVVSVLTTYLFGVDFGFWQAMSGVILGLVASEILFFGLRIKN